VKPYKQYAKKSNDAAFFLMFKYQQTPTAINFSAQMIMLQTIKQNLDEASGEQNLYLPVL